MSFLARRKHRPDANRLTVFDDTADDSHASIKSTNSFRRRLSSLSVLSSKLARSRTTSQTSTVTKSGGIAFTASYGGPYESYASHSRSPSPEPSLEIRRPSGLGRRASLTSEQWWSSADANAPAIPMPSDRKRSISTPELSLPLTLPDGLPRWSVPSETDDEDEEETRPEPVCMVSRLSPALLKSVFGFVPRSDLPSVALACKAFLEPTRTLLYSDVDLMPTDETHSEQCMTLLASRRDLAGVVQRFSCNVVPSSSSTSGVVPLPAVTFAIAVSNMRELTSLTLPQFDAALLHHATFHLTSLAFLCQSSSRTELQNTFAWLAKQPNITSLSFPNLVLDDDANQWLAGCSGQLMCIPEDRNPSRPATPVFQATLLPRLAHLSGPTSLVSALTPGRPLSSLAVSIQRTIYDGLRPSALAGELARGVCPVTHLCVLASAQSRIDARTFERVLMAMGSELGSGVDVLEVECALDDQVLHKQIHGILPRYRKLHTLRLRLNGCPELYDSPPHTPSTATAMSFSVPTSIPPSPMTPMTPSRSRANTGLPVRTQERAQLGLWSKQCPPLRSVHFTSGGCWKISEGPGGLIYTFIGTTKSRRQ